jgi:hypothetical protein
MTCRTLGYVLIGGSRTMLRGRGTLVPWQVYGLPDERQAGVAKWAGF